MPPSLRQLIKAGSVRLENNLTPVILTDMDPNIINFQKAAGAWFASNWWIVLIIVLGAWLVNRFGEAFLSMIIRRAVRKREDDVTSSDVKKRQNTLIMLFTTLLRVIVWLVAFFSIFKLIFPALDLTPILAGASVLGVALGFGSQTLIKDFIGGLFIVLENQYRVGDVVELDGAIGTVEQISLHSTVLRDNDGNVHYIPNGTISHAINKTMGFSKINLVVEVDPSTDIDKLAMLINDVGAKMAKEEKWKPRIIDPARFLGIDEFSTSTIAVRVTGKTQPSAQWSVTGELRRRLLAAFKKDGIVAEKVDGKAKKK